MRGQSNVVATTLIITVAIAAAAAYYVYSQGLFATTSAQNAAALDAKIKLERFIKPMSGQIYPLSDSVSHFVVQIYNSGDVAIPYSFSTTPIRWYLYNNDVLVAHGGAGSLGGACAAEIPAATICSLESDVPLPEKNYGSMKLVLYINTASISIPLQPVPFPGVAPFYVTCDSCDSCNAKIAALSESNAHAIVFIPNLSANGDCIDINGKSDLIISCLGDIVGNGSGAGIVIANSSNLDIRNCDVSNFSTGIVIEDSNNLKFSGTYSHDNAVDLQLSGDISKSCSQNDWDVRTTRGRVLLMHGASSTSNIQDIGQASAIWFVSASNYSVSAAHQTSPGGLVDPIILVCNSQNVHISDYDANTSPRGIVLYRDTGTDLVNVTIDNVDTGIYSVDSNSSDLDQVSIGFSGGSAFISPEQFSWGGHGGDVTFHD